MSAQRLQERLLSLYGAESFLPGLARVGGFLAPELARVRELAPRIVTVAGTNGKGETALALASLARAAGIPHILWTSPHLLSVTERFRCEDGEIPVEELAVLVEEGEELRKVAGSGLSYYEALWAAFVRWGLRRRAPLWILEVGMGGRLDAVNLLDAHVVALPSVSRDHQEYLGPTYRAILGEKLGVLRAGATLVSTLELAYLRSLAQAEAQRLGARWQDLFASGEVGVADGFSSRNRRLAERAWEALGFTPLRVGEGAFPGRGERWRWGSHEWVFYGSHNPDGVRKLVQFLRRRTYTFPEEKFHQVWAAFSRRPTGDLRAMARALATLADDGADVKLTQFEHPKAVPLEAWWRRDEGSPVQAVHEWSTLFPSQADEPRRVLVTGSYYFVALVQERLRALGGAALPERLER